MGAFRVGSIVPLLSPGIDPQQAAYCLESSLEDGSGRIWYQRAVDTGYIGGIYFGYFCLFLNTPVYSRIYQYIFFRKRYIHVYRRIYRFRKNPKKDILVYRGAYFASILGI